MAIKVMELYAALRTEGKGQVAADIKDLEKQAVTAAKNIEKNFGAGFSQGFGQAGQAMESLGARVGNVAGLISNKFALAGAAITGFALTMKSATQAALAFDAEFQKSAVFLSNTPGQIANVEKALKGLDARLGSAAELLPTFRKALLDSADPKVALEMTKLAASFAKVTDTTPTQAVGLLGDLMDSFGIKADKARRITDVLFLTMQQGGGDVAELAANFPRLADAAAESNIQIEELGAALATLGQVAGSSPQKNIAALILLLQQLQLNAAKFRERGVDVSALVAQFGELGGRLRAIRQFATDVVDGKSILNETRLRELGISFRNLNATVKLISDEGLATLAAKTGEFNRDAPGATENAFKKISATVGEQFARVGTEIDKLKERLGAPLLIPVRLFLTGAADVLEAVNQLEVRRGRGVARPGRSRSEPDIVRPQQQRAAAMERLGGAGIESGIPPLPEGPAVRAAEAPSPAEVDAERALRAGIRGRMNADAIAALEARGRAAGRGGRAQLTAQSAVTAALQFERDAEAETAKLQERSIQGTAAFFDRKVALRRDAAEIEKRIIADTSAADLGAARERIKGLDAEIAAQRQRTQPGGDAIGGALRSTVDTSIEGLLQQRDAARRQLTELTEKSADDRRGIEQRLVTDLIGLDKERLSSMRSTLQEEFAREKDMAEGRFALRRTLSQASLKDEIEFWAGAARAAEQGTKEQLSSLQKVAAAVKQQRDEARGVASEQLSAVGEILQEQGIDPEFARLNNVQIEDLLQRRRIKDEDINARANAGVSVGLKQRQGALSRLGLHERGEQAGGFGKAMRDATMNVAEKYRDALASLPAAASDSLGKVVESWSKHFEELERITKATIARIMAEIGKLAGGPGATGGTGGAAGAPLPTETPLTPASAAATAIKMTGKGTAMSPFVVAGPGAKGSSWEAFIAQHGAQPGISPARRPGEGMAEWITRTSQETEAAAAWRGALDSGTRLTPGISLPPRLYRPRGMEDLQTPRESRPTFDDYLNRGGPEPDWLKRGLDQLQYPGGGEPDISGYGSALSGMTSRATRDLDGSAAGVGTQLGDAAYRRLSRRMADELVTDLDRMIA